RQRCQHTAGRVDAPALDGRRTSIGGVQDAPVRVYREDRWRAGGRRLAAGHELAGAGVDTEARDLVVFLQAHVQHVRHVVPPVSRLRSLLLNHAHPEHDLAADVDVVLVYESELAVVADTEDRQTGRDGPD